MLIFLWGSGGCQSLLLLWQTNWAALPTSWNDMCDMSARLLMKMAGQGKRFCAEV